MVADGFRIDEMPRYTDADSSRPIVEQYVDRMDVIKDYIRRFEIWKARIGVAMVLASDLSLQISGVMTKSAMAPSRRLLAASWQIKTRYKPPLIRRQHN